MLYLIYQFYILLFAVENVFQWIDKINENIEGIAYNVERITVGTDDVLSPLEPTLMIQYNTKMNSVKVKDYQNFT